MKVTNRQFALALAAGAVFLAAAAIVTRPFWEAFKVEVPSVEVPSAIQVAEIAAATDSSDNPEPRLAEPAEAARASAQELDQPAPDFDTLYELMLAGDTEAGRLLYRSLNRCQDVPFDASTIELWRRALEQEADPHLIVKLRSRVATAELNFSRCAVFNASQRSRLREILELAAAAGDAEAAVRLLQINEFVDDADPLAESARAQQGRRAEELAMSIVRSGDPSVLSELSAAYASGRLGRPNTFAAYETLFASALAAGHDDPFQGATRTRLAALRDLLSDSEAESAEANAESLIEMCCANSLNRPKDGN